MQPYNKMVEYKFFASFFYSLPNEVKKKLVQHNPVSDILFPSFSNAEIQNTFLAVFICFQIPLERKIEKGFQILTNFSFNISSYENKIMSPNPCDRDVSIIAKTDKKYSP